MTVGIPNKTDESIPGVLASIKSRSVSDKAKLRQDGQIPAQESLIETSRKK